MLTSHDALGARELLREAWHSSIYNPNETPGMFAKVRSLLSAPASVHVVGPGAPGQGSTFRAGLCTRWSLFMQMNSQTDAN